MLHRQIAEGIRGRKLRFSPIFLPAAVLFLKVVLAAANVLAQPATTNEMDPDADADYWDDEKMSVTTAMPETNTTATPLLTTADEVLRLSPEEAARGYPVDLRGVVTCAVTEHNAFIVQDATHAVFVFNSSPDPLPQRGEFLEVKGKSDKGSFAPLVRANQFTELGAGALPEPVQPTWDQLMNGSLDDQLVEIGGIVEEADAHPAGYPPQWSKMILRTTAGSLWVDVWLVGTNFDRLQNYQDAMVRVRGCLFVALTLDTHELELGHVRMYVNDIEVDQPAPADVFSAVNKHASDLTQFDPEANSLQQVKVSGQILYIIGQDYFMMEGTNGVRFTLRRPIIGLHSGDFVDVAGYPELNGAAPCLVSAVARKTGHAPLPVPRNLSPEDLPNADYDSTRVRIVGLLVSTRVASTNEVLEIQAGSWGFIARVHSKGNPLPPIGSLVALTGVYAAQGGNAELDGNVAPFDLLLHSAQEIQVLSKPSWWTLRRLLVIVGVLVLALAFLVLWVTQLHRQVEDRTAQLTVQIHNRERVEHQRAMEQERARIAQDLHDELGSGITEISMLATVAGSGSTPRQSPGGHLKEIGDRAREMVTTLDEIVWAMNPKHDSLKSLVSYSCLYADRLLRLANITCQLKGTVELPDRTVSSGDRHEFFLAVKEAITNIIRHSGATEVRLGVRPVGHWLRLSITDNGHGLPADANARGRNGLANMRARLEKMGGRFAIASQHERGTIVRFYMPLD